jgi:hypothetical protein
MKQKYVPASELLPAEDLQKLSRHARRMYGVLWNFMSCRGRDQVTYSDANLANRLGVSVADVVVAQAELTSAGRLDIWQPATGSLVIYKFPAAVNI